MFSAGIRQSEKTSCEVTETRSEYLPLCSTVSKPSVPRSTRKPRTPSSVRAQTTATSAMPPLVIHAFSPLSTQESPSRRARVRIPPGLEPKSGSVRPKQPMALPAPRAGIQRCFCSSEPHFKIGNITSEVCTETKDRSPESPRSSSWLMSP